ncbi:WD repeat-containing protein 89 [Protopterus annectens]|uniref:WD repeat-containing protein 89 n=1 Tax=Protopterus annectens TaxID=7888 RepID=UPI001CFA2061|nr:WD repeat-containing protein 89 [Protopterus annectens]
MDEVEKQFASLLIAKRSVDLEDPTYLLNLDCLKSVSENSCELVAVSCSNHFIRVYDKESLKLLSQYKGHSGPVCGIRFAQKNGNILFSASGDGTVKCWDIRSSSLEAVQIFNGYPSNVFTSFDISCNDIVICAGTEKVEEDSFMVFWDSRFCSNTDLSKDPLGVYSESHSDDITQICFHPTKPDVVVSGSTDGLVNIFDISIDNEDDALLATCNSDSSVSFVNWCGEDYRQICCLTHSEGLVWWNLAHIDTEDPITLLQVRDAREAVHIDNGNIDYLIGSVYHEKAERLFVLAGTFTGKLHLINSSTEGLTYVCSLKDGHSAMIRSFHWNQENNTLLTAGEDAQLLLWKPGALEMSSTKRDTLKLPSSVHHKVRVHSSKTYKSKKK